MFNSKYNKEIGSAYFASHHYAEKKKQGKGAQRNISIIHILTGGEVRVSIFPMTLESQWKVIAIPTMRYCLGEKEYVRGGQQSQRWANPLQGRTHVIRSTMVANWVRSDVFNLTTTDSIGYWEWLEPDSRPCFLVVSIPIGIHHCWITLYIEE